LGHTATDRDLHVRTFLLEGLEVTERAVELEVRVLSNGARVEDHDVRVALVACGNETVGD
jgi:hypothetical protein